VPGRLKRKVEKPLLNSESWQQQWAGWQLCGWKIVSTWKVFPDRLEGGTAPRNNVWRQNPWTDWNLITRGLHPWETGSKWPTFPLSFSTRGSELIKYEARLRVAGGHSSPGPLGDVTGPDPDWLDFCWLVPWLLRPWHVPWGPKIIYLHLLSSLLNLFSPMKSHVFAKVVDIFIYI